MQKFEEIRNKLADEYAFDSGFHYGSGDFDNRKRSFLAAFDAQLDAISQFMDWLPHHYHVSHFYEWVEDVNHSEVNGIDIFKYFLQNVYQPK